jgi:hypothetical protein
LRLVRSGPDVTFSVAEGAGAEFNLLHQCPFGEEDLESIDLVGSTGGPRAALDVRFTDLRVTFPHPAPAASAAPATTAPRSPWKIVLALAIVVSLAVLGGWLVRRQVRRAGVGRKVADAAAGADRPAAAPAPLAFKCPRCGKGLRARAELAGKKFKCPGCGQPVGVPETGPGVSPPG